jgi:hypothetical protein
MNPAVTRFVGIQERRTREFCICSGMVTQIFTRIITVQLYVGSKDDYVACSADLVPTFCVTRRKPSCTVVFKQLGASQLISADLGMNSNNSFFFLSKYK